ncbi:MAG: hypothetical protein IKP86_08725 [Anaerolineaceae bacterium]|nr:hypothetical protein [Anaerolineaceae bacterium]
MTVHYRINELWEKRACPSYQGFEPYIFLSFAPCEIEEGIFTLSVLNRMGCRVWYDERMLTGRPWTGEICDAIGGCTVFFEVSGPGYHVSLTKNLASEFASLLEKKIIYARLKAPEKNSSYSSPTFFYSSIDDPEYPDLCRKALEHTGYFSAKPAGSEPEKYDLMLDYYKSFEDWKGAFGGRLPQHLNLRTHESHGYLGHYPRSDEDVYTAVRYGKKERFYLRRRGDEEDYKPNREDKLFMEKIRKLNGEEPDDLRRKYVREPEIPKPHGPFPAGYPYMDEFEYLSSDDK